MENVKALLQKKIYPFFLKWVNELDGFGYDSYYQVMNAADYGVPQHRERVFCVSIRRDGDACITSLTTCSYTLRSLMQ